jgi:hypothetical protein
MRNTSNQSRRRPLSFPSSESIKPPLSKVLGWSDRTMMIALSKKQLGSSSNLAACLGLHLSQAILPCIVTIACANDFKFPTP